MSIFFNKKSKEEKVEEVSTTEVFVIPQSDKKITIDSSTGQDILQTLKNTSNKYDAIDAIISRTPDGKMAYNTYLRIANQGVKVELFNAKNGRPLKKYDTEMRQFCANMGGNTSNGLDGLIDQLHASAITHGGMACEVVVGKGAKEIESVIIIDPKTITEFEWQEDKKRYAAYQQGQGGKKVDLYDGNFYWIPHQPKPGRPDGTLQFEPAIATMIEYYQLIRDSLTVLNRIGFPKYDIAIDLEKMLSSAPPDVIADRDKRKKFIQETFNNIKRNMAAISPESDIVHYDSITVSETGGGVNGSGIDVRAWFEMLEPLIVNSFQLTPVLMGRLKSGSYSLGTAEYKIVKDTMEVLRRDSKRMIENIINLWARVMGYNVYAVVTHNPIEWQVEKEKFEAQLLKMQKARRAEEYKYIAHDEAAIMAIGDDADPQEEDPDIFEYVHKEHGEEPTQQDDSNQDDGKGDDPNV